MASSASTSSEHRALVKLVLTHDEPGSGLLVRMDVTRPHSEGTCDGEAAVATCVCAVAVEAGGGHYQAWGELGTAPRADAPTHAAGPTVLSPGPPAPGPASSSPLQDLPHVLPLPELEVLIWARLAPADKRSLRASCHSWEALARTLTASVSVDVDVGATRAAVAAGAGDPDGVAPAPGVVGAAAAAAARAAVRAVRWAAEHYARLREPQPQRAQGQGQGQSGGGGGGGAAPRGRGLRLRATLGCGDDMAALAAALAESPVPLRSLVLTLTQRAPAPPWAPQAQAGGNGVDSGNGNADAGGPVEWNVAMAALAAGLRPHAACLTALTLVGISGDTRALQCLLMGLPALRRLAVRAEHGSELESVLEAMCSARSAITYDEAQGPPRTRWLTTTLDSPLRCLDLAVRGPERHVPGYTGLSDHFLDPLRAIDKSLRRLRVHGAAFALNTLDWMAEGLRAGNAPALRSLSLTRCRLSAGAVTRLLDALAVGTPALSTLSLSWLGRGDAAETAPLCAALAGLRRLRRLRLGDEASGSPPLSEPGAVAALTDLLTGMGRRLETFELTRWRGVSASTACRLVEAVAAAYSAASAASAASASTPSWRQSAAAAPGDDGEEDDDEEGDDDDGGAWAPRLRLNGPNGAGGAGGFRRLRIEGVRRQDLPEVRAAWEAAVSLSAALPPRAHLLLVSPPSAGRRGCAYNTLAPADGLVELIEQ